jgi:xylulokinase
MKGVGFMGSKKYVVGVDCGTTSSKTVIYDLEGHAVSSGSQMNPLEYYPGGKVICSGQGMIDCLYNTTRTAIDKWDGDPADIIAVSFCMFRSTMCMREEDGKFAGPIMIWQDLRGGEMLPYIESVMDPDELYDLCGMPNLAANPSSRLYWVMQNEREVYDRTTRIHTMQGLMTKAYGADDYYDDITCSPYMQLNGPDMQYSKELADKFGVDINKLAPLRKPTEIIGKITEEVAKKTGLKEGTPLVMGTGDQQCGCLGVGCTDETMGYACGGTAGIVALKSSKFVRDPQRKCYVLTTPDGAYVMEGLANNCGSAFRWCKGAIATLLNVVAETSEQDVYDVMTAKAHKSVIGAHGCIFLPYLSGASTPNNNVNARGSWIGMTMAHTKADLIRAVMEGVTFDILDMFNALRDAGAQDYEVVRVTGGVARSDFWNQIQADVYNKIVETVESEEATSLGAAIMAATGVGAYDSLAEAADKMVRVKKRYYPIPENVEKYQKIYKVWRSAYKALNEGGVFDGIAELQKI